MSMTEEQVARFCLSLPGAREDYKWGGVRVFSIAGNKMFALQNLRGESLAFKVDKRRLGGRQRPDQAGEGGDVRHRLRLVKAIRMMR